MEGIQQKNISKQDWQRQYRELDKRHQRFLKRYDQIMQESNSYKSRAYHLEAELQTLRPKAYQADQKIDRLEQRIEKLESQNDALRKQLASVKTPLNLQSRPVPSFVKLNVPAKTKSRPGRKVGHEAAHRPLPAMIDVRIDLPLPKDATGVCTCPHCNTQLNDVKEHQRIV